MPYVDQIASVLRKHQPSLFGGCLCGWVDSEQEITGLITGADAPGAYLNDPGAMTRHQAEVLVAAVGDDHALLARWLPAVVQGLDCAGAEALRTPSGQRTPEQHALVLAHHAAHHLAAASGVAEDGPGDDPHDVPSVVDLLRQLRTLRGDGPTLLPR